MATSPSHDLHERLKRAVFDLERAEKNVVALFSEVLKRKIHQRLGYGTIHLYASAELGFSKSKTSQFVRLAETLEKLPALKREVTQGAVSWTKARAVVKVATPKTESDWIELAKSTSRRQLERSVDASRAEAKSAKKRDPAQPSLPGRRCRPAPTSPPPSSVTLRFTPEQLALFEVLLERLRKQGMRGSREELLLAAMEEMSGSLECSKSAATAAPGDRSTGRGKVSTDRGVAAASRARYQLTVKLCPKCEEARVVTSKGDRTLDPAATASVLSDADRVYPGKRKRAAVPPGVRRAALERANHRCEAKGCGSTHFLEIDHIIPVAAGGTNHRSNLRVLCSACHRARHRSERERGAGDPSGPESLPG